MGAEKESFVSVSVEKSPKQKDRASYDVRSFCLTVFRRASVAYRRSEQTRIRSFSHCVADATQQSNVITIPALKKAGLQSS